jgi:hypothetical protein
MVRGQPDVLIRAFVYKLKTIPTHIREKPQVVSFFSPAVSAPYGRRRHQP